MTDTPEAVRLADQIHAGNGEWMQKAAALLRRIPGLEADYQRLMDKHNALHINALASRQRVAELEAEVQEQARLNGMGAERELALMAQVSRLEAERDQLRAELEKVRVPEGWKLVPVEPTREMWEAVNKLDDEMAAGGYDGKGCSIEQAWNCLLDFAPTPPNADQKGAA